MSKRTAQKIARGVGLFSTVPGAVWSAWRNPGSAWLDSARCRRETQKKHLLACCSAWRGADWLSFLANRFRYSIAVYGALASQQTRADRPASCMGLAHRPLLQVGQAARVCGAGLTPCLLSCGAGSPREASGPERDAGFFPFFSSTSPRAKLARADWTGLGARRLIAEADRVAERVPWISCAWTG